MRVRPATALPLLAKIPATMLATMLTTMLTTIFPVAIASTAAFPLLGCSEQPAVPAMSEPVAYTIPVKGMHCEGCEGAIVGKVTKIPGVTSCKASHTAEAVEVVAPIEQRDAITAAITRLGYKIE